MTRGATRTRWWLWLVSLAAPVLLTVGLVPLRHHLNLVSDMLLFLLVTVLVSLVGGMRAALLTAIAGSVLLNYYFTPPLHTLSIEQPNNALALVVFALVAMIVSGAVDLAARRTRQAAQAEAQAQALAAGNKLRTSLLAALGHDLRTPLAGAKASVSSLLSPDPVFGDDDRHELLLAADESLDRLARLVENLLDLSRLQVGALTVQLSPTDLEEVVVEGLRTLGPAIGPVLVDVPDGLPLALADPGLLERIIANLVGNALRFAPPGRPPLVTATADGDRVQLRIIDHGPGVPAGRREAMFVPFQRLGDSDNAIGVGLGLALSRGLADVMGGTLEPEETPGGGLTMVVSLPARAADSIQPGRREREASS